MKTLYAACLARLGISQAEAALRHNVRLDTIKSWASGRAAPPPDIFADLRAIEAEIAKASAALEAAAPKHEPIKIENSQADAEANSGTEHLRLMAAADFVLNNNAPVDTGRTRMTHRRVHGAD